MTQPARTLEQLQHWMQAVITHHAGVAAGVECDEARHVIACESNGIESVIPPGPAQSSLDRLAVYGNAYFARLINCLREQFPTCRHCVGDEIFDEFAFGYLQEHAPRSYTLANLASEFVGFLDRTRREQLEAGDADSPTDDLTPGDTDDWTHFLVELARFEFAIDEIFDGPGIENNAPMITDQFAGVPAASWPSIRLTPVVCLRLFAFDFPVNEYYSAFRRGESPELPSSNPSFVAVTRRDYVVRRYPITNVQHELLAAIIQGATIEEAVQQVARFTARPAELASSLSNWFSFWAREQFFARLDFHSPSFHTLE